MKIDNNIETNSYLNYYQDPGHLLNPSLEDESALEVSALDSVVRSIGRVGCAGWGSRWGN